MQTSRSDREFHFTDSNFATIKALIYDRAGINLAETKKDMVYSRLSRRLRVNGLNSFQQYLDLLADPASDEQQEFVNSLTTNLASFFREAHHFDALKAYFSEHPDKKKFRIWCCAASTGEEPYSIAMAAIEYFGCYNPPVEILASDLDTKVLEKARQGVYAFERVESLSDQRLKAFFFRGKGNNSGLVKVKSELQDLVFFLNLNLLNNNWPFDDPFDIIFCRNVMIYFDKPTQYKVLKKFVPYLKEDGLLFAGHSESFPHASDLFRLRKHTVYVKATK
ncbi:CheR family methyltransferase [Oceanospirillum linum]|uniref:Chemotaxis protein methyltransferase n=1 Tax=Oceanospirillum linum TaxID=966 RepID=A0A1T1HAC3_OCELI|nr:CheR family methyltransferase [Oceanospirillum linum]OOV86808.1 chemotaxis protein CheR [Oceanospirillum linum]SEG21899.1 MCP methyltransferase, CheR-type [Oleiphilus messinensis]SMP25199.1 MCP methyltransferase, CheR-type [Oceanospirillum linum]